MNVYKKKTDGQIYCTPDGDGNIEGFDFLGFDESITDQNKAFLTGYDKKKKAVIFDIDGMAAGQIAISNSGILREMGRVKQLCVEAMAIDDQDELKKQRAAYNDLKGQLK